jgi:hypothetical protein
MNPMSAERIARNDSAFRAANEHISNKATAVHTANDRLISFICECADSTCTSVLQLNLVEYEDIRADSRQFLNALDHDRVEGLVEVMFKNHNYLVVKKFGRAGEIAEQLDDRRNDRAEN